jgi:L-histidine N-alpha-methyltransferase
VDLGAGDAIKTMILLEEAQRLGKDLTYIPIDISKGSNEKLAVNLSKQLPHLSSHIITGEFEPALSYIR